MVYQNLTVNQIKELKNGCAVFVFERSELPLNKDPYHYYYSGFELTASVTEQGTGQMQITKSNVQISDVTYSLEFIRGDRHFQPGIPYKGQVKITNNFEDLANKKLKICYVIAVSKFYNYSQEQCRNISLNGKNLIDYTILPFYNNVVGMNINAILTEEEDTDLFFKSRNYIKYNYVDAWSSPTNSYIHISYEPTSTPIKCKAWQTFTILYTINTTSTNISKNPPIIFNYLIKSKGNIIKFGKVSHTPCGVQPFDVKDYINVIGNISKNPPLPIDKFILTLKIQQKMFSEGQLLVYYVRDDGEIVGTSVNFEIENCLPNKVDASWSESQSNPGAHSVYKIKAAAGSLCAVSAIDKKGSLFSQTENLDVEKLLQYIQKPYFYDFAATEKCKKDYSPLNGEDSLPFWDLRRKKRYYNSGPSFFDTFQVFNENALLVMTDLNIITRPCYFYNVLDSSSYNNKPEEPGEIVLDSMTPYHTQGSDKGISVRTHFPETWLWDLVPIGVPWRTKHRIQSFLLSIQDGWFFIVQLISAEILQIQKNKTYLTELDL